MGSAKANTLKPGRVRQTVEEIHLKTVTMGGKKDMSKKNNAAKSEKMVVDKTFGMKNKKDEAKSRKQAKKDHEAEIALLFDVVPEKKKKRTSTMWRHSLPRWESKRRKR